MRGPQKFTFHVADRLESAYVAPLLCAGYRVYSPLKRWISFPGARETVLGIGGLGHLVSLDLGLRHRGLFMKRVKN